MGAPGLAKVSMSFNPIYDWTPIGSFQDGVIEIPLEAGHLLTVHAVKYGPGGFDVGGPFTVYGSIDPPETTLELAREILDFKISKRFTGDRLDVLREATANNPFGHMGRGTIGNSTKHSEHFIRVGANFGKSLTECSF